METVKVKPWGEDQGDYVVINKDDFDSETHELYEDEEEGQDGAPKTVADLRKALEEMNVDIPEGAKKGELKALYDRQVNGQ